MSSFKIFDIAGSALSAQSLRLNTVASNLANADAIIEEANRLPYGLAAYAWTNDPQLRSRLAADVEALELP